MDGGLTMERTPRRTPGFTLAELLTCIAIISVTSFLAITSLRWLAIWQLHSAGEVLLTTLQSARSMALDRRTRTFVCPADVEQRCSSDWSQGVAIVVDTNRNQALDEGDEPVYGVQFGADIRVQWRAFRRKNVLSFTPEGFTHSQNGRFYLCLLDSGINTSKELIVNKAGRTRLRSSFELPEFCAQG